MKKLFKNKDFMLLWTGQSISDLGTWINFVGLTLYIYQIFGSGKILGLFMVVRMLPALIFGSLGGYIADRYSCKTVMIICDILRAALVLAFLWTTNLYAFFVIGLLLSALDKVFVAARGAIIPGIVEKEDLMEANSLSRMTHSVITIVGPAIAALLVSKLTYRSVFIVDSLTFVVSFITVLCITSYVPVPRSSKQSNFIEEFKDTFRFFGGHLTLMFLTGMRILDATGSGAYNVALPIFSKTLTSLKGSSFGWLIGAWALGEFSGSLSLKHITNKINISKEGIFALSVILMATGMGMTFHTGNLYIAMIVIFFGGFGDGIAGVMFNTELMKESPDNMRGKIFGTTMAMQVTAVALGMAVSGFFLDKFPMRSITDFCSFAIAGGTALGFFLFKLKNKKAM